jgi:hypothetical protein
LFPPVVRKYFSKDSPPSGRDAERKYLTATFCYVFCCPYVPVTSCYRIALGYMYYTEPKPGKKGSGIKTGRTEASAKGKRTKAKAGISKSGTRASA